MWYQPTIIEPVAGEPVSLDDAKAQCGVLAAETSFDAQIARLIRAARAHVEAYCGILLGAQTVAASCDGFADLLRPPVVPIGSVDTIEYVDVDGDDQHLPDTVYEAHLDGMEPSIVLRSGQSWPAILPRSRVVLTVVAGLDPLPDDIQHAMLLLIAHWFAVREAVNVGNIVSSVPMSVDALLANHRRWTF